MKNLGLTHSNCSSVLRETHLPLNGHRGYVLKHDELHLSVLMRHRNTEMEATDLRVS